ncbi:MAG: alanine-zipper protein [Steroidobacteraceae bacterium]
MNKTFSNTLKAGAAALVLLSAAGCQTKAIDEVRAMAQKAQQDAAAAQATANSAASSATAANSAAAAAKSAADNAQSTANQALQAAQTAQAGVDATNQKLDRMFKQSVSK